MSRGAGEHHLIDQQSGIDRPDGDELGAFASESDLAPARVASSRLHTAPGGALRSSFQRALDSPALVAVMVALAVVIYGALLMSSWERARPRETEASTAAPSQDRVARPLTPPPPSETAPIPEAILPLEPAVAHAPRASAAPPVAVAAPRSSAIVAPTDLPSREAVAEDAPIAAESPVPTGATAAVVVPPAMATAAAPAAAPPVTATVAVDPVAADRSAIGRVLNQYRQSYNTLDAASASTIWKGLDTRALERAFATLRRQDLSFDRCTVDVTATDRAIARCRGVLSYVPKIGDDTPQQRRLSWTIDLERADERWLIAAVAAR